MYGVVVLLVASAGLFVLAGIAWASRRLWLYRLDLYAVAATTTANVSEETRRVRSAAAKSLIALWVFSGVGAMFLAAAVIEAITGRPLPWL